MKLEQGSSEGLLKILTIVCYPLKLDIHDYAQNNYLQSGIWVRRGSHNNNMQKPFFGLFQFFSGVVFVVWGLDLLFFFFNIYIAV